MKILDWTKVIGIVGSGGFYSPSNETSEEKLKSVFPEKQPMIFTRKELPRLQAESKSKGFKIIFFYKGLNR